MTKDLRKQITVRSKLRNIFSNNRNWCKYKRQCDFLLNIFQKTKKRFYQNLDEKSVSDNKIFSKNVKPFFSDKGVNSLKTSFLEKTQS